MPAGDTVVLIVDDEPVVRSLAARILQRAGYQTLGAADGLEALEICHSAQRIDAVLSDIKMPRMTGPELARCLADHKPEMPILFMTGHAPPDEMDRLQGSFPAGRTAPAILSKPFSPDELVSAMESLIAQP